MPAGSTPVSHHVLTDPTTSSAPLFQQIVDVLRQEIVGGDLPEHTALPSERVVAEQHGVSRMTARRALEAIEAEGLAYSEDRRGRFVSPSRVTYDISQMVSFAADAKARGVALNIEVLNAGKTTASASLARLLGVSVGEVLLEYTRLFRLDGHATFLETEFVIARRFPDLLSHDLRQSTTELLEEHYATHADVGDITIRMRAVDAEEAEALGLAVNIAGIELEQVIRDRADRPFCVGRQIWRGELAEFSARAIVSSGR